MRYFSEDRNCCVSAHDSNQETKKGVKESDLLADITITHPCLVSIRKTPNKDGFILRSKLSRRDVCSFPRTDVGIEGGRRIDLEKLQGLHVTLLDDAHADNDTPAASSETPFQIIVPPRDDTTTSASADKLHPDIETLLMDVITRRKALDDAEVREYVKKKQAQYAEFEAEVKEQAGILSALVTKPSDRKGDSSEDLPAKTTHKGIRRLSANSSQSASSSSTSAEHTRRKSQKSRKRTPVRSATAPVPKSALSTPHRKTSTHESTGPAGGPDVPLKRVMFSEQEPTRIDSPHVLEPSDVEDYGAPAKVDGEQEDLFDMDEQIPVVPIDGQVPASIEIPDTGSIEMPNRGQPFGRQADNGVSGSFALRSLEKYGADSLSPVDDTTMRKRLDISDAEGSPFATSLPRTISRPAPAPTPAPLSSVKDIPAVSPATTDSDFDTSGDTPPKGVSRKNMWRQAVASSMRMSGIVMPGLTPDDLDPAFLRAPMSGQSLRS
ncbi:protein of unknown function [Taphrina deformans PYCC 5710]|uniref:Uncharacterized protein n=1 Tax=Taphrina deformans (strain PYCC 5710 / ATCC 11124 / CBS 356.35 / IMI 108563 / JCM 9778 / NBRC 8474) TaxID=1097556 RepID=R4XAQ1_TAPDE|nr:protein of unknown function [Taphrina deformans PYCC 5710]|eukprot:CCG82888.1 protein of unknown function [Taphrina deformans PYCC 5710]